MKIYVGLLIICAILIALPASEAPAQCTIKRVRPVVIAQPVVVAQPAIVVTLSQFVNPLSNYSVYPTTDPKVEILTNEIIQLKKDLQELRQNAGMPRIPDPIKIDPVTNFKASKFQDPSVLGVLKASCIECHSSTPKGNKLTLINTEGTQLADISIDVAKEAFIRVVTDEMPPKSAKNSEKIDDKTVGVFKTLVDGLKPKGK